MRKNVLKSDLGVTISLQIPTGSPALGLENHAAKLDMLSLRQPRAGTFAGDS